MRRYSVVLSPEPDGSAYNVTVPTLPGCFTFGATAAEALENAREAVAGHVAALEQEGLPVPEERAAAEVALVEV